MGIALSASRLEPDPFTTTGVVRIAIYQRSSHIGELVLGLKDNPVLELRRIWLYEDRRNYGRGSTALQELIGMARLSGYTKIIGTATPEFARDRDRFRKFFHRHRFTVAPNSDGISLDL